MNFDIIIFFIKTVQKAKNPLKGCIMGKKSQISYINNIF